jgi:hypothetical protein
LPHFVLNWNPLPPSLNDSRRLPMQIRRRKNKTVKSVLKSV